MASTPPSRMISIQEPPPTPRHGPAYDDFEPRYTTRSSQRTISREVKKTPEPQSAPRVVYSVTTPVSKGLAAQHPRQNLSPPMSPLRSPKHMSAKRVQVLSPTSPGPRTRSHDLSSSNNSFSSSANPQSFLSTSTIMSEGMLPTPVKTPRKKTVSSVNSAARALFQEQLTASNEIMPTPKKSRKSKRHNGFSLESVTRDSGVGLSGVQIFTDSRDNVPELDLSAENPFVNHPTGIAGPPVKHVSRTSKRRKISIERKKDPQVEEAIKQDEGMVYVFRGKKVFKRFDDGSEEEESNLNPGDLGLLDNIEADAQSLRLLQPLRRRSIRPTRLFQTEEQKRVREAEKAEEEMTDLEDGVIAEGVEPRSTGIKTSQGMGADNSDHRPIGSQVPDNVESQGEDFSGGLSPVSRKAKIFKKSSPFDSWKRVKPATASMLATAGKGRKRTAATLDEAEEPTTTRKLRNR